MTRKKGGSSRDRNSEVMEMAAGNGSDLKMWQNNGRVGMEVDLDCGLQ